MFNINLNPLQKSNLQCAINMAIAELKEAQIALNIDQIDIASEKITSAQSWADAVQDCLPSVTHDHLTTIRSV